MAIQTKSLSNWLAENPTVVMNAIKEQVLAATKEQFNTEIAKWLAANGQAITNASKASMQTALQTGMKSYMEQNLRPLQDGVFIGKAQKESWGTYMRIEEWQRTNIGITQADADAIVIQLGGYRLGISLDEPAALAWGSSDKVQVNQSNDMNSFDGKTLTAKIMMNDAYKNDAPATYAVAYAYNYSKTHTGDPGGDSSIAAKSWWLPSMGDLSLIHQHFETINLALQRIQNAGKQKVTLLQRTRYWSSCEPNASYAWCLHFGGGSRGDSNKVTNKVHVRPVAAF